MKTVMQVESPDEQLPESLPVEDEAESPAEDAVIAKVNPTPPPVPVMRIPQDAPSTPTLTCDDESLTKNASSAAAAAAGAQPALVAVLYHKHTISYGSSYCGVSRFDRVGKFGGDCCRKMSSIKARVRLPSRAELTS